MRCHNGGVKPGTRDLTWALLMRLIGILAIVYLALKFVVLAAFWVVIGPVALVRAVIMAVGSSRPSPLTTRRWIVVTRDGLIERLDAWAFTSRNWLGRICGLSDDPLW